MEFLKNIEEFNGQNQNVFRIVEESLKNSAQKKLKSTVSNLNFNFSSQNNDKKANRIEITIEIRKNLKLSLFLCMNFRFMPYYFETSST